MMKRLIIVFVLLITSNTLSAEVKSDETITAENTPVDELYIIGQDDKMQLKPIIHRLIKQAQNNQAKPIEKDAQGKPIFINKLTPIEFHDNVKAEFNQLVPPDDHYQTVMNKFTPIHPLSSRKQISKMKWASKHIHFHTKFA